MAQPQSQVAPPPPQMSQVPHMSQMAQMSQMPQAPQMPQMPQMTQQRPPYSQSQQSPSPSAVTQPGYAMPPNKRPRPSAAPPQTPAAPSYGPGAYTGSQQMQAASPAFAASPSYPNVAAPSPAQPYAAPHANGNAAPSPAPTPALTLPETRPSQPTSPAPPAAATPPSSQQYTTATMAPINPAPPPPPTPGSMPPPTPGSMPPPSRPIKEVEYDVSDSLAGTGIDLRAEEQYLAEFYGGSFAQEARTGTPANAPGGKGSFYGAGPANQPGEPVSALSQEAYEAEAAQRVWDEAAHRLAVVRSNEILNPFLLIANLHQRVEKIAKEHGIGVNLELKNPNPAGKLRAPQEFPQPQVTVGTKPGPDGVVVMTTGSFIPHDAYLVDQLALVSVATKHRLRELLEDASSIAVHRQTTSHGEIPPEWADVAVPLRTGLDSLPDVTIGGTVDVNPRKRSFDEFASSQGGGGASSSSKAGKRGPRNLMEAVRDGAKADRDVEEARLRKRQKRVNPEPAPSGSRAGSVAPGTPGAAGAAPETETKAPSKKESKKGAAAARLAEASSTASANLTLSTMMGKKKKEYSWLTKAGAGGPSTPRAGAAAAGADAAGSSASGGAGAGRLAPDRTTTLTPEPRHPRLGTWREDKDRGKNVQLRDWVVALEMDGIELRALQDAYLKLDASLPKERS